MNKALFLDRDGILNHVVMRDGKACAPQRLDDFRIVETACSLLTQAREAGFLTVVITNQPDVGRGLVSPEVLQQMHDILSKHLPIDSIEVCTSYDNTDRRRKPNPGMILDAVDRFHILLAESFFVGDTEKDILAGKQAGVRSILLRTSYNRDHYDEADFDCDSLDEVARIITTPTRTFIQEREV